MIDPALCVFGAVIACVAIVAGRITQRAADELAAERAYRQRLRDIDREYRERMEHIRHGDI